MSPAPLLPQADQVRSLPSHFDRPVAPDAIDENGHMNISVYFREGSWAAWLRLGELGMGEDYIPARGLSFFTVEHSIRYLGELRLGEPYAVHTGIAGRTSKAVHAVSFVLDRTHDRVACVMEVMYVHVSMETRRACDIPDDIAGALDAEIAAHPWVAEAATRLSLRR
ncbi:thioesterase family protein [Nocardioides sp.]|uniref:thioesterase family protein n=1 Tax=Nocardioides sp. TaxID=35761 RepID=UPI00286B89AC|nr:thioesterase family protein [Nocardioides sp.]